MPLLPTDPLAPGSYYTFMAEHAEMPSLAHTVAELVVLAHDTRQREEPWVLYLIQANPTAGQPTPVLAACTLFGLRRECSPSGVTPWLLPADVHDARAQAAAVLAASPAPGQYTFPHA